MMDRRSWPWKKKSSEKAATTTDSSTAISSSSGGNKVDQDSNTTSYVQISAESYAHLTELQDQVKTLQEKLSAAQTEMTTKDNLVKQHAKVAEEAVSGWEKAEAESSALKNQLESVTLLKLTAEERASHLDGALKECMKQIRNVKEESEQKLHDVVFAKTKQWEKMKAELEAKLDDFDQELLRASAENAALSRSLQERADILMRITDEKMQADTEIEVLKGNILSCEKEINSLNYELHVVSKELEIRNEEKNMSIKSADVANKQHLEDVKKISKLEAECQRLRGLVRKKLPGPAALAQMKLEVESLGRDHGESRLRRSPAKNLGTNHISTPALDFASESIYTLQKDNEFLTARLLATEEETKMLKEALSNRNSELQASRNIFAKTANKLRSVETRMLALNPQKVLSNPSFDISSDTNLSQNESHPPSLTSMSEDGNDEVESYSEPWAIPLTSDLSQIKKEKGTEKSKNTDNSNNLELMDDFLEMERLACLSTESNGTMTISDGVLDKMKTVNTDGTLSANVQKDATSKGQHLASEKQGLPCTNQMCSEGELATNKFSSLLRKLQSRIDSTFNLSDQEVDIGKALEDIKQIVQETQEELPQHSVRCVIEENYSTDASCHKKDCYDDVDKTTDIGISSKQDDISCADDKHNLGQEFKNALSEIQEFVISLGKESSELQDRQSDGPILSEKIQQFSSYVNDVLHNEKSLNDLILILSHILSEASEMGFKMTFKMGNEWESNISDCIDKVTLLENRVAQHEPRNEILSGRSMALSHSSSHPDIEGPISDSFEQRSTTQKFSSKEFEEMKLEKENMQTELSTCTELLEGTKHRLVEAEQSLAELKSQLAASQKSNSLSETQLKCMAESYKLLESRAQQLEAEVNILRTEVQTLNNELGEEKRIHRDDLTKLRDLQEKIERNEKCSMCSDAGNDKAKQEKEIAAAAEKLAECQETILLLGRQLQTLRPPAEQADSFPKNRNHLHDYFEDALDSTGFNTQSMHNSRYMASETESAAAFVTPRTGGESPLDGYSSQISPSDNEASPFPRSPINSKHQKHRSSRSSSSTSFPNALPEKQGRAFSRFFSKTKGDH
ncbi:plant protein [Musa troglodytarum]|uniref:Plant protein n=1 Tax=Musa troglodytarum TaxID=320322 RepID=A0A9E7FVY4_9LILI|nr:plant protein [Musa troglodytarum]URE01893.1 plant protein [Musa troglodytarum]